MSWNVLFDHAALVLQGTGNIMNRYLRQSCLTILAGVIIAGCQGPAGPTGPAGRDGLDGQDGKDTMYVTPVTGTLSGNIIIQDTSLVKFNFFNLYMLFNGKSYRYNISTVGVGWNYTPTDTLYIECISKMTILTPKISNVPPGTYTITFYGVSNKGASLDTIYFRHNKTLTAVIQSGMHGDFGNLFIPEDFQ